MTSPGRRATTLAAVAALAAAAAAGLARLAPDPSADVARGSEDAFADGLQQREIPPRQAPQRWTTGHARFSFRHLPPGPARLEVRLRAARGPAIVATGAQVAGDLGPQRLSGDFAARVGPDGRLDVALHPTTFRAGDGRELGVLLERVTVRSEAPRWPDAGLLVAITAPAVAIAAAALALGSPPAAALLLGGALAAAQAAALWPQGVLRSPYALALAAQLLAGIAAAFLFARWRERCHAGHGRWALLALAGALLVQGMVATSPLLVVSDAVFHAHKLEAVAAGDLFPTSVTQHARPFRFPYGVSFYLALAPLARAGADPVALVRWGAAVAALAGSAALFLLLSRARGAAAAAAAVLLLQLLPVTLDVHAFGNLSNVLGQALGVAFLAWWVGGGRGGPLVGGALLGVAALTHFSSFVVLAALAPALVAFDGDARRDRRRLVALAGGLLLSAAYYATFAPLVLEQLPRLLEGAGAGVARPGPLAALAAQLRAALVAFGGPALVLVLPGRPRSGGDGLDRTLAAFWAAGGALLLAAAASPLEVRYLYALSAPLAAGAGVGLVAGLRAGGFRALLAAALALAQASLGFANLVEALLHRYRG